MRDCALDNSQNGPIHGYKAYLSFLNMNSLLFEDLGLNSIFKGGFGSATFKWPSDSQHFL